MRVVSLRKGAGARVPRGGGGGRHDGVRRQVQLRARGEVRVRGPDVAEGDVHRARALETSRVLCALCGE